MYAKNKTAHFFRAINQRLRIIFHQTALVLPIQNAPTLAKKFRNTNK